MRALGKRLWMAAAASLALAAAASQAGATILPLGFVETAVVDDLVSPTAMALAPDGRLFVAEQDGRVRIVKNAALLDEPFVQLTVDNIYERGLLGIALDPAFASNGYVYVYFASPGPRAYRIVRFTAEGDQAKPGSETLLFELPPYGVNARYHFGGAMHFGPDGKLYLGVGDHSLNTNAQKLTVPFGKILRINPDGSIPTDNPFYATATGVNRAIWAYGLRNPFTMAFDPASGRLFINDVGAVDWEEIDEGTPGGNYGWPQAEGPSENPAFIDPIYAYEHGGHPVGGCAITAGVFYSPAAAQFPQAYEGGYFFADFCGRWIRWLDTGTHQPSDFVRMLAGNPTDLDVGPDGSLFVLVRPAGGVRQDDPGAIYRIFYTGSLAPQIAVQPESQTVLIGDPVTFAVESIGADGYQWRRNGMAIDGAVGASYTLDAVTAEDDQDEFRVVVHNGFGETVSAPAVLTATTNQLPVPSIVLTRPRELYHGGDLIEFSGAATDPEDGPMPPSSFSWRVDFHHNSHFHPYLPPTPGVAGGSFSVATLGETATDVWYRVNLRVTDSGGRTTTVYEDVLPEVATFTVQTQPAGLEVVVDGRPYASGAEFDGVVGLTRELAVEPEQTLLGTDYVFDHWSDGGGLEHLIQVPPGSTTYTAVFTPADPTTTTSASPQCGNAVLDDGEDCDDGDNDFHFGDPCRGNCTRVPCGKPTNSPGAVPVGSDALFTLAAAVGQRSCAATVCDVDSNGHVLASDALAVLRAAVGLLTELDCPAG
ncbi:MAG TPA: PQQ-dependent sugar dehydrogenase [Candidatus Limnocylindrales bacterium]|nr:PQQ-dependent sugar dehydrogenase [Candidatus Limnocylindrales bacterium]